MEAALTLTPEPAVASRTVVQASGLERRYGSGDTAVDALRGVSLEIPCGHLTAIMGPPSGSGKSTLMHILAGLDRPTAGSVRIDGTELSTLGDAKLTKLRRQHIGFVFQFFNLDRILLLADGAIIVAGVLAAILPARRAARLDVLQALHAE